MNTYIPEIVLRAMVSPITDISQLSAADLKNLNNFVKQGILAKGKGGAFPRLKTVYALIGHDFAAYREQMVKSILQLQ